MCKNEIDFYMMADGIKCKKYIWMNPIYKCSRKPVFTVQRLSYNNIALMTCFNFPTETRAGNREQKVEERLERVEEDRRRTRRPKQFVQRTAGRLQRPAQSAQSS